MVVLRGGFFSSSLGEDDMESDSIFCLHLSYHQDNGTGIRNIHVGEYDQFRRRLIKFGSTDLSTIAEGELVLILWEFPPSSVQRFQNIAEWQACKSTLCRNLRESFIELREEKE